MAVPQSLSTRHRPPRTEVQSTHILATLSMACGLDRTLLEIAVLPTLSSLPPIPPLPHTLPLCPSCHSARH